MPFLRGVWKIAVGVKDALVLIFLLILFGLAWSLMSAKAPRISVPSDSALTIELDGILVDQATQRSPLALVSGEELIPEQETRAIVEAIDLAAGDKAIKLIALDLDRFLGGGLANLQAVGDALGRFRAAGKTVEAYATSYGDDGYYLAAHANRVWLSPMGAVLVTGPGGSGLYFKDALDRLKVNVEVFRVGTYKSFVEPYTRNDSSDEARAADQILADDLWAGWRAGVERERPKLNVAATLESWPARIAGANQDQAKLALDAGFVDRIGSASDWRAELQKAVGTGDEPDRPGDYARIGVADYLAARRPTGKSGAAVAVVHVAGTIVDGRAPMGQAGGDSVVDLIDEAVADSNIKALVLRVDSGGGSALASEQIRLALNAARAKKLPVIASFGPVAASGGYWVATGADAIYANPNTITGSIGVFGIIPTFERSLKGIGISSDGVRTTPFSGQPDLVGGLNDPTRALIQGSVGDTYRRFIALVAEARKMAPAEVEKVAEGRVWSGRRAKDLGLIDGFGDLDFAVAEAGRRAGIEGKPRVVVMREKEPLLYRLLAGFEGSETAPKDALARAVAVSRSRALAQVQTAIAVASGPTVQAHCLTCTAFSPPRSRGEPKDLLRALVRLTE